MADFLTQLGALSLGGAVVILLLTASSLLTRSRYAARWRCWGWLLLCLRLAVPLPLPTLQTPTIPAPIQLPAPSDQVIYTPAPTPSPPDASGSADTVTVFPSSPPIDAQLDVVAPSQPLQSSFTLSQLLFVLWLAGAAAVLLWNLRRHLCFSRYLRRWSSPVTDPDTLALLQQVGKQLGLRRLPRLLACQGLAVPMLAGLARPALLLPQPSLPDDQLHFSLLHELTHYRRRDILFKALGLWTAALHWFNPAVWLMVRYIERDTELSCDDDALRLLPSGDHAAYGRTILAAVERLKEDRT